MCCFLFASMKHQTIIIVLSVHKFIGSEIILCFCVNLKWIFIEWSGRHTHIQYVGRILSIYDVAVSPYTHIYLGWRQKICLLYLSQHLWYIATDIKIIHPKMQCVFLFASVFNIFIFFVLCFCFCSLDKTRKTVTHAYSIENHAFILVALALSLTHSVVCNT